jgi:hypothetical protein
MQGDLWLTFAQVFDNLEAWMQRCVERIRPQVPSKPSFWGRAVYSIYQGNLPQKIHILILIQGSRDR